MKARPLAVTWKQFSLVLTNDPDLQSDFAYKGMALGRTMIAAARTGGNDAVSRLYLAIGDAIHGRKADPLDPAVMRPALDDSGLPQDLLDQALADPSTDTEYRASHQDAASRGAFGVPTLFLNAAAPGYFGPIIDPIPNGEKSIELWDHTLWALQQPYLWEFKRERRGSLAPQPAI